MISLIWYLYLSTGSTWSEGSYQIQCFRLTLKAQFDLVLGRKRIYLSQPENLLRVQLSLSSHFPSFTPCTVRTYIWEELFVVEDMEANLQTNSLSCYISYLYLKSLDSGRGVDNIDVDRRKQDEDAESIITITTHHYWWEERVGILYVCLREEGGKQRKKQTKSPK